MKSRLLKRLKLPRLHLFDTAGLSRDVRDGLYIGILGVTFCMVFSNVTTGVAWTGFQRMLGADSLTLGLISAIPVAASTLQIFAAYILEKTRKRRALFLVFGLISRLAWVGIGLIPLLLPMGEGSPRMAVLMVLLLVSSCGGAFINVSFYSLMGDLVPLRIRGRYFSARQAISLLAGIVTGLFVSWLMDRMSGFAGYTVVLILAGVFGALDICCFFFLKWPPMQKPEGRGETLPAMLKSVLRDSGYMKIVGYFTLWFFAVNIIAPFNNVYFLEQVKMTFTEITLLNQVIPNVSTVFIISWWGRQMDRYGNQPIVQTAGLYCMILPLAYILTGPRSFLILPFVHVFSGMAWPASDLGQQNMYLAKAPAHNRSMYVAVFFASTQLLGTALSNFVGGLLMSGPFVALESLYPAVPRFSMTRYDFMFLLSSTLRILCVVLLLPRLRQESDTPAAEMWRAQL
ncbi:MAG: MFS transporter, partial [Firmicutes bacterium]|nr:MFS transporter [Bacillota bacterium]